MRHNGVKTSVKVAVGLSYVLMITMNVLANALPINGRTTAAVSDSYPNLFAPAGLTFAIWGVIYLLLGAHVLYQLGLFQARGGEPESARRTALLERVGVLFAVSSLVNAGWIVSWHYQLIGLSALLLATILVLVIAITNTIRVAALSGRDRAFVRLPFSAYFGWLTVATIANITVWLVSVGWDDFGLDETTWAVVIIAVGAVIGLTVVLRNRDLAYGLVLVWAYFGIWLKHTSATGFQGAYPAVIITTLVSMAALVAAGLVVVLRRRVGATG
jgi:hypothetical protein